jgi:hypothetical protein
MHAGEHVICANRSTTALILSGNGEKRALHWRRNGAKAMTFNQCVDAYLDAHNESWSNTKHRQQWRNTLTTYAGPVIGGLDVAQIDTGMC